MTRASDTAKLLGAGATILDGTTISTADNTDQLTLLSTDADANVGPNLNLFRNSGSPADDDVLGLIIYNGRNDNSQDVIYARQISYIKDASDGSEDGQLTLQAMVAGTIRDRLNITPTEIVLNEESIDSDFRVESGSNANMLFVDGGNDAVVVGQSAPDTTLSGGTPAFQVIGSDHSSFASLTRRVASSSGPVLILAKSRNTSVGSHTVVQNGDVAGELVFIADDGTDFDSRTASIKSEVDGAPGANDTPGRLVFMTTADGANSPTERVRIDSAGAVHVATTSTNQANVGISLNANGNITAARDGGQVALFNRKSSDGVISSFRMDGTEVGAIGSNSGANMIIGTGDTGLYFNAGSEAVHPWNIGSNSARDNAIDLGRSGDRFQTLYATTDSINTSDKNEKQDIEELTDAEKRVAIVAKGLLRKYRWKDAVAKKGDKARIHFGIMAQDLQDAFTAESLDASRYGMFCSDTWWEKEITVDAVEAKDAVYEEVTDSDGNKTNNLVSHAVEAKDAYTYIDTKQEATEGYTEKTRLGVRYNELLAFIISAI